jgi:hypothetical protein
MPRGENHQEYSEVTRSITAPEETGGAPDHMRGAPSVSLRSLKTVY